jgi:hypothetical protein
MVKMMEEIKMISSFLFPILFGISAILIVFGVFLQAKAILDCAKNADGFGKFWAISMKYFGFAMLAYLVYESMSEKLFFNLFVFVATYIISFLLYLLARRVSIR